MADEKESTFSRLKRILTSSPGAAPASAQPAPPPDLGGAAGNAQKILKNRGYQLHLQEMEAMGQQPLTPEQYANTH